MAAVSQTRAAFESRDPQIEAALESNLIPAPRHDLR
jgi:hypothetical protein